MRILHIIGSMDPVSGGPCQGIRNLNKILEQQGIHREIVSMDDPKATFLGSDPFTIHALGPARNLWNYNSKLFPWLLKNLDRFDTVIVNGIWLYHAYATIKARNVLKKRKNKSNEHQKIFIMLHGMLDPYFQKAPSRRFKALRNWIYWKLIESKNIEGADGLFFACEEEQKLAKLAFNPYNPKREYNIGYGVVEPPLFTSLMEEDFLRNCEEVKGREFLLFLGRIHQKKGIDLLIQAYKKVYHTGKEMQSQKLNIPMLVIAGPGLESKYGHEIQLLVWKLEVQEFVFFPGMLTGDAKWGAFYMCESFVLSSHQENFGIAVAEALACSKSVLISSQVNIWREIYDAKAGLVADDTSEGTFDLLFHWANLTRQARLKMGINARSCFEAHFAVEPVSRRLIEIIRPEV